MDQKFSDRAEGDQLAQQAQESVAWFQARCREIEGRVAATIVGQEEIIRGSLICLFVGGHALLEGAPGLGKTLTVKTLAAALGVQFSRIQFTPDLMPADIIGATILAQDAAGNRAMQFQPGPLFANLVLADEINRATPKTQSAMLEAMAEQTISVGTTSHRLADPFLVLATQNPLEMEGTYPLPEAQLDRFALKLLVPSPGLQGLLRILDRTGDSAPAASPVMHAGDIATMRRLVCAVVAATDVKEYIAKLVLATHPQYPDAPAAIKKYVRYGASPRAAQTLLLAGKARALMDGRAHLSIADVKALAAPALRHRLILNFEGQAEGITPDELVNQLVH